MSELINTQDELSKSNERVVAHTAHGSVKGGRALNGAAVFLEIPYALPPGRFEDPQPLPKDYQYEDKEYIHETSYAVQPHNDGQAAGRPFTAKVGLGKPTENPLFLNIYTPPCFTGTPSPNAEWPVKVYIHGGFLQFGSPHGIIVQHQFVAKERCEVWVNVGYRLSAFGFLACDEPKLDGNYGFKDMWLALEWVKENIGAFGGDSASIQLTGLSAGAHAVHQLMHHASHLPDGVNMPFGSVNMQSNAIISDPRTPADLRPQFVALCDALALDPSSPSILADLCAAQASEIVKVIETEALGVEFGTFRGALSSPWLPVEPSSSPMEWQRSGLLAERLLEKGMKYVVVGDLIDEWFLYAIAHPIHSKGDVVKNLDRYYSKEMVQRLMQAYPELRDDVKAEEAFKRFGEMLSDGQVHVPVRLFARDLSQAGAGLTVVRYEIRWTPEQGRPLGYVTHGTDRPIWAYLEPFLDVEQRRIAKEWLDKIDNEAKSSKRGVNKVLRLTENKEIKWGDDEKWARAMDIAGFIS